MHDMRRMVPLRIESGGERQHMGRTKLHTEAACLAALDNHGNASFSHGISTLGAMEAGPEI
jgi:hypothetical protein